MSEVSTTVPTEEDTPMKIIDCTPPADLPEVVLMRDPKYGFWIRVANESGGGDCPHEGYFPTLPGARAEARKLGLEPEAWITESGTVMRF